MTDPTSRGDIAAALLRDWYEKHRESWWSRHSPFGAGPDRSGAHADEFMLGFMAEAARIANLDDAELLKEYGS